MNIKDRLTEIDTLIKLILKTNGSFKTDDSGNKIVRINDLKTNIDYCNALKVPIDFNISFLFKFPNEEDMLRIEYYATTGEYSIMEITTEEYFNVINALDDVEWLKGNDAYDIMKNSMLAAYNRLQE